MKTSELEGLQFQDALTRYVEMRQGKIMPRTYEDYKLYIKYLCRTFREICQEREHSWDHFLIDTVNGDWCRWYQVRRDADPGTINKELGLVRQVRKQIAASGSELRPIDDYQRLQMAKDYETPGRRLEPDEEKKFDAVCVEHADHSLWQVAALTSLLGKTGAGPGEIKSIKLKNVHLAKMATDGDQKVTYFRIDRSGAKRVRRQRKVVCEDLKEWALQKLYDRALRLGCSKGDHYLLPRMNRDHTYDPTRKCRSWWLGLQALLELAGTKFRSYDLRHHAVSTALEDGELSFPECELYFGHISAEMKNRYYHGTTESLQKVARSIGRKNGHKEEPPKKPPLVESATKKCPECWSDIPVQAKRCRYCQAVIMAKAAGAD